MQTGIQIDDAVLAKSIQIARENGYDLSHLIEEVLRDPITPAPDVSRATFSRLTTCGGNGLLPGVEWVPSQSMGWAEKRLFARPERFLDGAMNGSCVFGIEP